jgi:DNA-binding response OmpR family regulator
MARILVIDDEPEVADFLVDALALDGHRVEAVSNGLFALKQIDEHRYDLLISDIRMPGLDGPGLLRDLQRHHPEMVPRLIFVSGETFTPGVQAFLAHSGIPTMSKPVSMQALRRFVQTMLDGVRGPTLPSRRRAPR